jgi:hypothetical protein
MDLYCGLIRFAPTGPVIAIFAVARTATAWGPMIEADLMVLIKWRTHQKDLSPYTEDVSGQPYQVVAFRRKVERDAAVECGIAVIGQLCGEGTSSSSLPSWVLSPA